MDQLQRIFDFRGQQMRSVILNDEPWFVAKDVCEILGISKHRDAVSRLDDDERGSVLVDTLGGRQQMTTVNESGLYELIFASRKPEAKIFKRWVKQEVLPSIRKHGAYMTPQTIEDVLLNPDTIIRLATDLKLERQERERLEEQRKRDEPYTNFGKAVSNSRASINVGAFAKMVYDKHGIKMGRNKMFDWLRDNGYLIKNGRERNNPKQQYIEQGLFETTVTMVSRTLGDVESITTLITGKGQVYFLKKLLNEKLPVA